MRVLAAGKWFLCAAVALALAASGQPASRPAAAATTFSNPVATNRSDPHIISYGGKYYYTSTDGCVGGYICVWQSATLTGLGSATRFPVFQIPACPAVNCAEVWAPEIHAIDGTFYIYYTAGAGDAHRIFALRATTGSPTGAYAEANTGAPHGQITESSNTWAIDPDVFQIGGTLYLTWSGWPSASGGEQDIFLASMSDPLHVNSKRVMLSRPDRAWEKDGLAVNEGPVGFQHGGRTFLTYSGSFCDTVSYAVGLLTFAGGDPLNASAWQKTGPIFKYHSGVKGSASFVPIRTLDGTEDWFLVHSNTKGCDPGRELRLQRLLWDTDGSPLLGYPVGDGVALTPPSGELGSAGSPNPYNQGWGNAFGDLAEGVDDGEVAGSWTVNSPTGATLTSFGGVPWTRLFRASNPNYETYRVTVDARWTGTGTTSNYPKYGIYASYDDRNNHVEVFIDRKNLVLATHAVVQGAEQPWQNAALPAGFDPAVAHRLSVLKTGATYAFSLDGAVLQTRTFPGTFPVLLNGQVGLVTEDSTAAYTNLAVTETR
ncbi:glycoside hydrolase family 43 protein [Fodinicola acaciae]|uniref:glycoside hydrolase family 43 protein n=1 Tax=Fodinicola acaciae TaxID=2681555 RepID=UPI0013D5B57E|nr:glycoside hydrolase family 43 protein [Fodinicola acaciae]